MRIEAASLVFVAVFYAVLLVAGISLYVYKYAGSGVYVMDRLPSVSPESPIIELAQDTQLPDAMPAPALGPARTPFLPPNFLRTWDMDSLQLDASKPASSFPEPVAPFERTTSFYASKGGKPLILLFTLPTCGYCRLERQALQNATARFGDEIEFLEIDVSTAPYLYQPVFMVDAVQNRVPPAHCCWRLQADWRPFVGGRHPGGVRSHLKRHLLRFCLNRHSVGRMWLGRKSFLNHSR